MRTFLTLVKTGLNVNFGISALKYQFTVEKRKRWEPILIGVSILIGLGTLLSLYILLLNSIYAVGAQINQPEIVLTISIIFAQFIVMFFGIFYIMGTLYFSKDINILLPLPLKPYEVLGSKFIVVIINEYLTILPMLLPAAIIYGVGTNQGLVYWLKSLIVILVAPIIPLNISALFIIILMRFINFRKSRDVLAVIGGLLGIFLGLGLNLFFQRIPQGNEEEFIRNIITKQYGMITYIGRKFPPSIWADIGLSGEGIQAIGYLFLFVAVSLLMFILLLWLGNYIFYKSLLAGQEVLRKRKIISRDEMLRKYERISSPAVSLFYREWKLLLRTPVYVLNCLAGTIIGPFMVILIMFTKDSGDTGLSTIINNPDYSFYIQLIGLAFMLYVSGINVAASTAISREGSTFWISKIIPVPAKHQVLAKFLNGFSIACLGVIMTAIVLAVFIMPVSSVVLITLLGFTGSVPLTAFSLMIDMAKPKLIWNNPQEAVKQNMNGLLGMLVSLLILGVLTAAVIMMIKLGIYWWAIYIILALIMSGLGVLSMIIMLNSSEKRYGLIEI